MADDRTPPTLLIDAIYRVGRDDVAVFARLASRMREAAERRDGCAFVKVSRDVVDPSTFRLLEGWRDQAALDAHLSSDEFQAILAHAGRLEIVERGADIYSVGEAKRLDMPS